MRKLRGVQRVIVRHIPGDTNPADLFTKHLDSQRKLDELLIKFNCSIRDGRPGAAPKLKSSMAPAHAVADSLSERRTQVSLGTRSGSEREEITGGAGDAEIAGGACGARGSVAVAGLRDRGPDDRGRVSRIELGINKASVAWVDARGRDGYFYLRSIFDCFLKLM